MDSNSEGQRSITDLHVPTLKEALYRKQMSSVCICVVNEGCLSQDSVLCPSNKMELIFHY